MVGDIDVQLCLLLCWLIVGLVCLSDWLLSKRLNGLSMLTVKWLVVWLVVNCRLSVVMYWLLAAGCRLSDVDCRLLVVRVDCRSSVSMMALCLVVGYWLLRCFCMFECVDWLCFVIVCCLIVCLMVVG